MYYLIDMKTHLGRGNRYRNIFSQFDWNNSRAEDRKAMSNMLSFYRKRGYLTPKQIKFAKVLARYGN